MKLVREKDLKLFADKVLPILEEREAVNSLMIGIILGAIRGNYVDRDIYFAYIEDSGNIVTVIVMTPPFGPVIYCNEKDCNNSLRIIIEDIMENGYTINDVLGRNKEIREFAEMYSEMTNKKASIFMNMRIYKLIKVNKIKFSDGIFRYANMNDLQIITDWTEQFNIETGVGTGTENFEDIAKKRIAAKLLYIWEHKEVVSMAMKTRPTRNYIAVSGVLTPKEYRKRGYATSLVASLSRHLLEDGYKACVLFTDLSNPISNSIYQKIGYEYVCDFDKYKFTKGE